MCIHLTSIIVILPQLALNVILQHIVFSSTTKHVFTSNTNNNLIICQIIFKLTYKIAV